MGGHGHTHGETEDHHDHDNHGHSHGGSEDNDRCQTMVFIFVGIMTLIYSATELVFAAIYNSLALYSDGFHNLSDVISLFIAFYAFKAKKFDSSEKMSFGYARSEILGGLINGSFLLSLCLYILLEAIPKFFIKADQQLLTSTQLYIYIGIAGSGVVINTIGTLIFLITGTHGHSHAGGGGHGHSHGGDDDSHGHSHAKKDKKKKKKNHGHSHGSDNHNDHEKDHSHSHTNGHGHSHGEHHHDGEEHDEHDQLMSNHDHDDHVVDVGHEHSHGHSHENEQPKKKGMNVNIYAMLIHYFGDALSSVFVLIAGLLMEFCTGNWVVYVDPATSILIVIIILWTTYPLLKHCTKILMQGVPAEIDVKKIESKILKIKGVMGVHDLHIWPLVEETIICSVHVICEEGSDFGRISKKVKKILHKNGIHSTSIQPEFVPIHHPNTMFCEQNCVEDCEEDWCCKTSNDRIALISSGGSLSPSSLRNIGDNML